MGSYPQTLTGAAMSIADLKPCPFCGSTLLKESAVTNTGGMLRYIWCTICHTEGPWAQTPKDSPAIAWNRRASQPDQVPTTNELSKPDELVVGDQVQAVALGPIERLESYDRTYIPLPGGWEVQTKGRGSTFRLCDTKTGDRLAVPDQPYLHETIERMAREIHGAVSAPPAAMAQAVREWPPCGCGGELHMACSPQFKEGKK